MFYNKALFKDTTKLDQWFLRKVMTLQLVCGDFSSVEKISVEFRCHSLCRAIAVMLPRLKVIDGSYVGHEYKSPTNKKGRVFIENRYCAHSWLSTPDEAIIDPYPVGFICANAVLVVTKGNYLPWGHGLYFPNPAVIKEIDARVIEDETASLIEMMQRATKWKQNEKKKNSFVVEPS